MTDLGTEGADGERAGEPQSSTGSEATPGETIMRCRTVAIGRFRQRHHVRDLPPFGDENGADERLGGAGVVADPSEALLSALGSCLSMSIHANAVARSIPISRLEIELAGTINRSARWGAGSAGPGPLGFEAISIKVHVEAAVPEEVIKSLVDQALLWSPVANTLHNPVHLDVALA